MAKQAEAGARPALQNSSDIEGVQAADSETLPNYADVQQGSDIQTTILELATVASAEGLELPITACGTYHGINYHAVDSRVCELRESIVVSFFDSITTKKDELVALMIQHRLVTANTTDSAGQTPLLAAIAVEDVRMVQELLDFDADVNAFGVDPAGDSALSQRTPLQLAVAHGNLTLVRLLMEVYHADDALVAPDGQLALRLAAGNGHRDIVAYLPRRRGGGWRRWKAKHAVAMDRARRAATRLGQIGKFFAWDVPYTLLYAFVDGIRWCWKHRMQAAIWCKQQLAGLPHGVAAGLGKLPKFAIRVLRWFWEAIKAIPYLLKWILRVLTKIPRGIQTVVTWLWKGLVEIGHAAASVLARLVSLLHTIFSKLVDFFGAITFKDIWNGLCALMHVILVGVPLKLWHWLKQFGVVSYEALKATFGTAGKVAWWFACITLWIITYIPKKVGQILMSFGESIGKAWEELLVWIDPKR
jgi:Ankyrin repeats (3 copies)